MKSYILLLFTSFALLFSLFAEETRPNIIFFYIDDLGYRDLGCYGNEVFQTPHIDKLASNSVKCMDAYVTAAVCSPSRASAMTGRHCLELGVWNASHRVKPETLIYPKLLSKNGYQTWHLGKWHMGRERERTSPKGLGFDLGLAGDESFDPGSHFYPYRSKKFPNHKGLNVPDLRENGKEGEYLADRLTEEAILLIKQRNPEKPFYLQLWHYGVHTPHEAKAEVIEKYKEILSQQEKLHPVKDPVTGTAYDQFYKNAKYAAMVESIDDSVGRVMQYLKENDLYENTFVIFYSDNGAVATTTQKPLRGYKNSLYEGGVRVPALFSFPGKIKPRVSRERLWTLDLFPTICELAGVELSEDYRLSEGVSLTSHLFNEEAIPKRDFYWYFPEDRLGWGQRASASILNSNGYKYHLFFEDYDPELFHIKEDIAESKNLVTSSPEVAQKLRDSLLGKLRKVYAKLPAPQREFAHLKPKLDALLGEE